MDFWTALRARTVFYSCVVFVVVMRISVSPAFAGAGFALQSESINESINNN